MVCNGVEKIGVWEQHKNKENKEKFVLIEGTGQEFQKFFPLPKKKDRKTALAVQTKKKEPKIGTKRSFSK